MLDPVFALCSPLVSLEILGGFVGSALSTYPAPILIAVRALFSRREKSRHRSEQNRCWRDLRLTFRPQAWQLTASNRLVIMLKSVLKKKVGPRTVAVFAPATPPKADIPERA